MPPRFNIPPLTRACLIASICLSVLYGVVKYNQLIQPPADDTPHLGATVPSLTIVPGLSIVYPWVFVIATLVEANIFTLAITLSTLFYGGKYLERAWGSKEFGKFLLVVSVVPNFVAFTLFNLWFVLTGSTYFTYGWHIYSGWWFHWLTSGGFQLCDSMRWHRSPGGLSCSLQAARSRAHSDHLQGHHQDSCEGIPYYLGSSPQNTLLTSLSTFLRSFY